MVVYVDLVFFSNLAVDGVVLLATAKARRLHPARWRIALSASVGAAYAAILFWAEVPYLYSLGAKLAVSMLMLLIAFGYGGPIAFLRTFGMFYVLNFVTLGGVLGAGSLLQAGGSPMHDFTITPDGGIVLDWRMQLGLFAVAFALSVWLFYGVAESRRKQAETRSLIWTAKIRIGEETLEVPALLDTGNRLYDPLTRTPVMIVEAALVQHHLPPKWRERLLNEPAEVLVSELDDESRERFPWLSRLRLVPYRGAGGKPRFMLAIKPDSATFVREDHQALQADRLLVGLDGGELSAEGAYRAILHPELISNGIPVPNPYQPV